MFSTNKIFILLLLRTAEETRETLWRIPHQCVGKGVLSGQGGGGGKDEVGLFLGAVNFLPLSY
jgi:hypothetical protein